MALEISGAHPVLRSAPAKSSPANMYWSVEAAFKYGSNTTILKSAPGIFDTGTTLLGLATGMSLTLRLVTPRCCNLYGHLTYNLDAYTQYLQATGAVLDETVGLLSITLDQYKKLQSLYFKIKHHTYEFNANAQRSDLATRAQSTHRWQEEPCLPNRVRPWTGPL